MALRRNRIEEEQDAWQEYLVTIRAASPGTDDTGRCERCEFYAGRHHPTCPGAWASEDVEAYAWSRLQERLLSIHSRRIAA